MFSLSIFIGCSKILKEFYFIFYSFSKYLFFYFLNINLFILIGG